MQNKSTYMHIGTTCTLIHMHSITYSKVCGRVIGYNYNPLFGPITIIMVLHLHMWVE